LIAWRFALGADRVIGSFLGVEEEGSSILEAGSVGVRLGVLARFAAGAKSRINWGSFVDRTGSATGGCTPGAVIICPFAPMRA
jgi:hypothetical protein